MRQSLSDYKILNTIGKGFFGAVIAAKAIRTGNSVAIKIIKISTETLEARYREVSVLRNLSSPNCHPNILCYYDSFIDTYYESFLGIKGNQPALYIVTEKFDGETLTKYLTKQNGVQIPSQSLHKIYRQLIDGCLYIHSRGYAHCDIKTDNTMISRDLDILYIDFGSACDEETCFNHKEGTIPYAPPEVFQQTAEYTFRGGQARDIWALGVILYQLRLKHPHPDSFPYDSKDSSEEIIKTISTAPDFEKHPLPDDRDICGFNGLIERILINDWKLRPTIFEISIDYSSIFRGDAFC
jgi:serine/threonine protein kinase